MTTQSDHPLPRFVLRAMLFILVLATTASLGAWFIYSLLRTGNPWWITAPLGGLFVVLTAWIAVGFWSSVIGFFILIDQRRFGTPPESLATGEAITAIVVPVYNESPRRVMAGLRATIESIQRTGRIELFHFYILSDSTDPETWLEEEAAWQDLVEELGATRQVFYRHRVDNTRRKLGNIEDFLDRWGDRYRYMVIFDADSVMEGRTLCEMVARMEADPKLGILQAPPSPVNRESLFARFQQFASHFYGPLFTTGLAAWAGSEGNYYGHNAIIRLDAFIKHCHLNDLPGTGPLGGTILSHDFVEAALMRRAGYAVRIASDLIGSYEETPTTVIDFAKRDQRWCQGNLQHLRLVVREQFHVISQIHLVNGAIAFIASPLWATFLTLSLIAAFVKMEGDGVAWGASDWPNGLTLLSFVAVMTMLILPKLLALIAVVWFPAWSRLHGGSIRATLSVLMEIVVSVLLAPMFMAFHTRFVIATLLGFKVNWGSQGRTEKRTSIIEAIDVHGIQFVVGTVLLVAASYLGPSMVAWLSPIWGGLLLSIPLSIVLSSHTLGRMTRQLDLLAIDPELNTPIILQRVRELVAHAREKQFGDDTLWIDRLRTDARLNRAHCNLLDIYDQARFDPPEQVIQHRNIVLNGGAKYLPEDERRTLLLYPQLIASLCPDAQPDADGDTSLEEATTLFEAQRAEQSSTK